MPLLVTEAIVLHAFDYLESSRIIRLLTREAGIQSVLARGARKSRGRYGSALDLFVNGRAQTRRIELAEEVGRFTAASTIAELALRFAGEEGSPQLYETVTEVLDRIARAAPDQTVSVGLAGCWRIVAVVGFTPELSSCALCHAPLRESDDATFSPSAGGVICAACNALARGGRRLPATARSAMSLWLAGDESVSLSDAEGRSHQRLLREFLDAHMPDDRPLRAFKVWEHERWSAA